MYKTDPEKPNPELKHEIQDKLSSVAHFKRARAFSMVASLFYLGIYLFAIYILVPAFFTHWILIIPFFLLLMNTRSFGTWDAYLRVREQSDKFADELDRIDEETLKSTKKFKSDVS